MKLYSSKVYLHKRLKCRFVPRPLPIIVGSHFSMRKELTEAKLRRISLT